MLEDVVVLVVVDDVAVVVLVGVVPGGPPTTLSTDALTGPVAFTDRNVVIPTEPAACTSARLSVACTVHVPGSGAPSGHTRARTVVGLTPTACTRSPTRLVGLTCAPATATALDSETAVPGAVRT